MKTSRSLPARLAAATVLAGLLWRAPVSALIERIYTLQEIMKESDVIVEGRIEKVDRNHRTGVIRVTRTLKGRCAYKHIKMNIGVGQGWHVDALMRHLKVDARALVFYQAKAGGHGIPCLVYIDRFFFQLFGDGGKPPEKTWWRFTHIEVKVNRTFNGRAEELTRIVREVLAGKRKPPKPDRGLPPLTREELMSSLEPREPVKVARTARGLDYRYYHGSWDRLPDFDELRPEKTGTVGSFEIGMRTRDDDFGVVFSGLIRIEREGAYRFYTRSDDGSRLWIGADAVVENDGLHPPSDASGTVVLKPGKHPITVAFFERSGGEELEVSYEGPGVKRRAVPASVLFRETGNDARKRRSTMRSR
jgi:hypothetical protein